MSRAALVLALAALWLASPALAADALHRLRDAVASHPDDPDLAWALGRSLSEAERAEEAIDVLRGLVERWEDHVDAQLRLGEQLVARGRHAEALPYLERAVHLDPDSGTARILLGACLDSVGRFEDANTQLVAAADLDPQLRPQALLLRAVSLLERGEEEAGFRLLEEVVELNPLGDVADAARLLLAERRRERRPRLRLEAYAGMDYDSNATLDNGSTPGISSDQSEGAGVWGALGSADLWVGDRHRVTAGARYHERDYLDLDQLDERTFLGFVSGQRDFGSRFAARFAALGSWVMLGNDPYLGQVKVRPELLVSAGEVGVVQIAATVEADFYEDEPPFPSLERDGVVFGGEVAHLFSVPYLEGARGSWGVRYERVVTDAERDELGFQGDYDRNIFGGHFLFELPLPWRFDLAASVHVDRELYDHDNLIDYLSQLEADGDAHERRRKDVLVATGVEVSRPIVGPIGIQVHWRFQKRFSNTNVYTYDRHVVGALLSVHTN